jgi:hypothetical protein
MFQTLPSNCCAEHKMILSNADVALGNSTIKLDSYKKM